MKKGFTLIELLAIVTLLGIVILVGMPSLVKSTKKANEQRIARFEETIEDACETYAANEKIDCLLYENYTITFEKLITNNYVNKDLEDPLLNNTIENLHNCTIKVCDNYKLSCKYKNQQRTIGVDKKISNRQNLFVKSPTATTNPGSDLDGDGTREHPFATITKAYESITNQAGTIQLLSHIDVDETIDMAEKKNVILTSDTDSNIPYTINRVANFSKTIINHRKGTLVLQKITFDGHSIPTGDNTVVQTKATLSITGNTVFQNCVGNKGSAVKVMSKGKFTMENGAFKFNQATSGGAILVSDGGTFVMKNGIISHNTSTSGGGGIHLENRGELDLDGGTISNNISSSGGGGIHLANGAIFNLGGGTISNNVSSSGGGGIQLEKDSVLNITGGTVNSNEVGVDKINDLPKEESLNIYFKEGASLYDNGFFSRNTLQRTYIYRINPPANSTKAISVKCSNQGPYENETLKLCNVNDTTSRTCDTIPKYNFICTNTWIFIPAKIVDGVVYYYIKNSFTSEYIRSYGLGNNLKTTADASTQDNYIWRLDNNSQIKNNACVKVTSLNIGENVYAYGCSADDSFERWTYTYVGDKETIWYKNKYVLEE